MGVKTIPELDTYIGYALNQTNQSERDHEHDVAQYINNLVAQEDATATTPSEQVAVYIHAALAKSTRGKYQSDLKRYLDWGGSIPATPSTIANYLAAHGQTHAPATLQRWLVSIGKAHTSQQLPNPCKSELVHLTLRGIRRIRVDEKQQPVNELNNEPNTARTKLQHKSRKRGPTGALRGQVKALELNDLKQMIRNLGEGAKDARDRALLLVGFMGARRRSELVAITLGDLEFHPPEGMLIHIPYSKTDQEGHGDYIELGYAEDPFFCPIKALEKWLDDYLIPAFADDISVSMPVFRAVSRYGHINEKALTDRSVARIVKAHCLAIGLEVDDFSGHSLRAGFATEAAKQGKPSWQIRKQTLHKSDTMLNRYIRDGQRFKNNPGKGML